MRRGSYFNKKPSIGPIWRADYFAVNIGDLVENNHRDCGLVWRQAFFRLATTKIPDTCCNFFLSSLVSFLLAVPRGRSGGPANPLFRSVRVYSCSRMFQNEAG